MSTFVLSAARLSAAYQDRIEALVGGVDLVLVVPQLRRLGPLELLRRLRTLRGNCVVVIEDPGALALRPTLEALAALTRARTITVIGPGLSHERVSRAHGIASLGGLALSVAHGQEALVLARRELRRLLEEPRLEDFSPGSGVLYLNPSLWFGLTAGGSVAHVAGVVNRFAADNRVTLATAVDPVGVSPEVEVVRLRTPSLAVPPESNFYRFGRSIAQQLRAVPQPSFLYQRHAIGSYSGVVVSRARRVPLVLEYNGSEVWAARNWGRPLAQERLALDAEEASLRHAQLVVTVSQALADELTARGIEPSRIVVHPNGVDPALFDPARFTDDERAALRRRYGVPDDAVLVTFVGTFGAWHGVPVLAEAIRRLAEDGGTSPQLRFLLVGDGPTLDEVRETLRPAAGSATLTGLLPSDEIPLMLSASDMLVAPHVPNPDGTPFFGSPTKLFEYMAAGKAIVASDLDQIGDVLRDDLAVLVRPGDPADLARAIRELAESPERRRDLGSRARERVLERYTWRHHVDAIVAALATPRS